MVLKITYDDNSELLKNMLEQAITAFPLVKFESYHENLFSERKKAFKLKGAYSARKNPFAIILDDDKKVIKVFYSEANECTFENIYNTLINYVTYTGQSDLQTEEETV